MSEDSKSQVRVARVKPAGEYALRIQWVNGKELPVDLRDIVHRLKGLRALRDPAVFARASVGEGGHSVAWPGDLDIGATRLLELGLEQGGRADAVEFIRWRWRHGLSLTAAAEALGLSRRQVAYYASGEQEVPPYVLLACRGWEAKGIPPEHGLEALHKRWALVAARRLQLNRPELSSTLYKTESGFTVHVANCNDADFQALVKYFDEELRPLTCNIRLSQQIPTTGVLVKQADDYEAELWLTGEPLPVPDLNRLLSLAEPTLPDGGIDFDNTQNTWVFRSFNALTQDERTCVQRAVTRIGILDPVEFVEVRCPTGPSPTRGSIAKRQGDLSLITFGQLKNAPVTLRDLVNQDEDEWRTFLFHRARQEIVAPVVEANPNFACLYDAEHCGDSRLSELLTLYDRVDLIPQRHSLDWSSKHQVSLADLQELVRLKRVRVVLPYSLVDYPFKLLEAVAEVDRSSLVLSRALAAKTIARGQKKEPLLYAPLNSRQRAALLSVLSQSATDEIFRGLLRSYGQLFSVQHDMFMMRGALASLGFGVGAYLGDVFFRLRNKDARLELMTCGAGIEWALGLGASYIPRNFGDYDETRNSHIIASYLGRTRPRPADATADRMHIISDGLLAVSGVPPLEVANNFHVLPASRFRSIARRLMETIPSAVELQEAVDQINAEVKVFERRADRLTSWSISGVIATESLVHGVDHEFGFLASIAAALLWGKLKHSVSQKIPEGIRSELATATAMIAGLATGSSLDAVVVSRSRKSVRRK